MSNMLELHDYIGPLKKLAKVPQATLGGVACFIIQNGAIVSSGVNYNPTGESMEHVVDGKLVTRSDVIHAEIAALRATADNNVNIADATLLVTMSPCIACATEIAKTTIGEVVYLYEWWDKAALDILASAGIKTKQIKELR